MARGSKRPGNHPDWLDDPIVLPKHLSPEDRTKCIWAAQMMAAAKIAEFYGFDPCRLVSPITLLMRIGPELFDAFREGEARRKPGRPEGTGDKWKVLQAIEPLRAKAQANVKPFDVFDACVKLSQVP
jgi:hypothetical protein